MYQNFGVGSLNPFHGLVAVSLGKLGMVPTSIVLVGIDYVIGNEDNYIVSPFILHYLDELGFITLAHIQRPPYMLLSHSYRLTADDLNLGSIWEEGRHQ